MLTLPIWLGPTRDPLAADRMRNEAMALAQSAFPNAKVAMQETRYFQGDLNFVYITPSQLSVARGRTRYYGIHLEVSEFESAAPYRRINYAEIWAMCFWQGEEMVACVDIPRLEFYQTPLVVSVIERLRSALGGKSIDVTEDRKPREFSETTRRLATQANYLIEKRRKTLGAACQLAGVHEETYKACRDAGKLYSDKDYLSAFKAELVADVDNLKP